MRVSLICVLCVLQLVYSLCKQVSSFLGTIKNESESDRSAGVH